MKGFGGMPGNLQSLMKQAQKMQADLQKTQEEIQKAQFEGSAGGGAVKVTMNGKFFVETVTLSPEVCNPEERELLQDMIIAAVNDVTTKIQNTLQEKMSSATGGLPIPGMF